MSGGARGPRPTDRAEDQFTLTGIVPCTPVSSDGVRSGSGFCGSARLRRLGASRRVWRNLGWLALDLALGLRASLTDQRVFDDERTSAESELTGLDGAASTPGLREPLAARVADICPYGSGVALAVMLVC